MTCLRSPSAEPLGWGDMPGWGAEGHWPLASVSNPRQADNGPFICTAQDGVAEPWQGQVSAKVTLSSPRTPLLRTQGLIPAPFPNQGRISLDCQRPRPGRDSWVPSLSAARK